jgi:hypothetical protein
MVGSSVIALRSQWALAAALLAVATSGVAAHGSWQQAGKPNFSGTWTATPFSTPVPPVNMTPNAQYPFLITQSAPSFGAEFVARQDAETLVVEQQFRGKTVRSVFDLTGVETRNTALNKETVSKARWDGPTLVIVTRLADPSSTGQVERVMRLEENGSLVIKTTGVVGRGTELTTYRPKGRVD